MLPDLLAYDTIASPAWAGRSPRDVAPPRRRLGGGCPRGKLTPDKSDKSGQALWITSALAENGRCPNRDIFGRDLASGTTESEHGEEGEAMSTIACQNCGEEFTPTRTDARYCTDRCRKAARRAREREEPDDFAAAIAAPRCSDRGPGAEAPSGARSVTGSCGWT